MNKNQAEARAKAVKTLERALTDRNKTIKELRKEVADLTSKLDLLNQEFCDKGPPKQTPVVFKNTPRCYHCLVCGAITTWGQMLNPKRTAQLFLDRWESRPFQGIFHCGQQAHTNSRLPLDYTQDDADAEPEPHHADYLHPKDQQPSTDSEDEEGDCPYPKLHARDCTCRGAGGER